MSRIAQMVWVCLAGGALVASCALPGYETDPNLKSSSSSSSTSTSTSSGQSTGGGQGGAGQGGDSGTGGAGGNPNKMPVSLQCDLVAPKVTDIAMGLKTDCSNFVDPMNKGPEMCVVPSLDPTNSQSCCKYQVKCMSDGTKHMFEVVGNCQPIAAGCPVFCGMSNTACGNVDPGTLKDGCACANLPPPPGKEPLPMCVFNEMACAVPEVTATYSVLSCNDSETSPGTLAVSNHGCCSPNGQCVNNQSIQCPIEQSHIGVPGLCPPFAP